MSHLMTSFFTSVRVKARRAKERTGLENGSIDQREQQAERRAVEVYKGAHKNLSEATDDERDHEGEESSEPDRDDCVVGQLCLEGEVAFEGKEGRDSLSCLRGQAYCGKTLSSSLKMTGNDLDGAGAALYPPAQPSASAQPPRSNNAPSPTAPIAAIVRMWIQYVPIHSLNVGNPLLREAVFVVESAARPSSFAVWSWCGWRPFVCSIR